MQSNTNSSWLRLSAQETTSLLNTLGSYYGCDLLHLQSYVFYRTPKRKIYLLSFAVEELDLERINSQGLYFASEHDHHRFRLSFEGTQFVTPTQNFITLTKPGFESYVTGEHLFAEDVKQDHSNGLAPFLIVEYEGQNLGCVSKKEKEYLTYLGKSRKLDFHRLF